MPATPADIEITRRYQARLLELAAATGTAVAQQWDELESYDDPIPWLAIAAPIVIAGQAQAAALAAGYVALLANALVPSVDIRVGPRLDGPFASFGSAIKRGLTFETAVNLGRSRADEVGSGSVQWTARAAAGEAARQAEGIVGWRRVLTGVSCDWCALISTQRYRTADSASFGHARCDCTVVPIIGDRDPGQVINEPVLDRLHTLGKDDRTGYVDATGQPAPRPEAVPQTHRPAGDT